MSYSYTTSTSFTRTDARYVASKIEADLRQCQRFQGRPTDKEIADYVVEITELLAGKYLDYVEYGFKQNGKWVMSLRYSANWDGTLMVDDRPGRVSAAKLPSGATWSSFLSKNSSWSELTEAQRKSIESRIPVDRTPATAAGYESGSWEIDRTYGRNGGGVTRKVFGK